MTKENGKYRVSTTMSLPAIISYQKQGCGKKSIKIKKGDEVPQEVFLDCTDEAIKAIIIEQTLDTDGDWLVDWFEVKDDEEDGMRGDSSPIRYDSRNTS